MTHTHYTIITRDERGLIERRGGKMALGKRGIPGIARATSEARVLSIEPDKIMGWGDATAIGLVQVLLDDIPDGEPALCLLS